MDNTDDGAAAVFGIGLILLLGVIGGVSYLSANHLSDGEALGFSPASQIAEYNLYWYASYASVFYGFLLLVSGIALVILIKGWPRRGSELTTSGLTTRERAVLTVFACLFVTLFSGMLVRQWYGSTWKLPLLGAKAGTLARIDALRLVDEKHKTDAATLRDECKRMQRALHAYAESNIVDDTLTGALRSLERKTFSRARIIRADYAQAYRSWGTSKGYISGRGDSAQLILQNTGTVAPTAQDGGATLLIEDRNGAARVFLPGRFAMMEVTEVVRQSISNVRAKEEPKDDGSTSDKRTHVDFVALKYADDIVEESERIALAEAVQVDQVMVEIERRNREATISGYYNEGTQQMLFVERLSFVDDPGTEYRFPAPIAMTVAQFTEHWVRRASISVVPDIPDDPAALELFLNALPF